MQFSFVDSILNIAAKEWDALWQSPYPFTRWAFFAALERSGSTNAESGWIPKHCVAFDSGKLVFAMPLFLKTHSYGEYVFDWAWADAYHRNGMEYYPKLLNAVPFTPATGPRWASKQPLTDEDYEHLQASLVSEAQAHNASSVHALFPEYKSREFFSKSGFIQRSAHQYHWFNRDYRCFDDFLQDLSSRKRKNIKKERLKCQGYTVNFCNGNEASEEDWQLFYTLYHRTYLKRSGRPGYLSPTFFTDLAQALGEHIVLALVEFEGKKMAGAVYFKDDTCLYGRYWGTLHEVDGLHFETCYYRGIEYAIEHKLKRFDPGAQGEHKIQRGFQPIATCSYHWLAEPRFHSAIGDFCQREAIENNAYIEHARGFLPFKEGHSLADINIIVDK